jgi:hypothetical protein
VRYFHFLIQIQILNLDRLGTGPNRNRSGPVRPVPTVSGPVPTSSVNHGEDVRLEVRVSVCKRTTYLLADLQQSHREDRDDDYLGDGDSSGGRRLLAMAT